MNDFLSDASVTFYACRRGEGHLGRRVTTTTPAGMRLKTCRTYGWSRLIRPIRRPHLMGGGE